MAEHEKFPSFNFFPRDWIAGTAELSVEQQGAFINLLAYAWEQSPPCTLPDDDVVLARWSGLTLQRWRKINGPIRARLQPVDGRLRNPKQWSVYLEACALREKKRRAGQQGNATRWGSQSDRNGIAAGSLPIPIPKDEANASSTSPTRLRVWLGERSEVIDRMQASAPHSSTWEAAVYGLYGPDGTDPTIWSGVPPGERAALLAKAIDRYAGEGQPYKGNFFRGILLKAINERNGNTNTGRAGATAQRATGTTDQSARRNRPLGAED